MRRRLVGPVVLIAAAGVLLAGCGSSSTASNSAVTTTPSSGSLTSASTGSILGDVAKASGTAKTARATITTSGAGQSILGEGVFSFGAKPAADYSITINADGQKQKVSLILVNGSIYLKLDDGSTGTGAKKWIKVSTKGTDTLSRTFAKLGDSLAKSGDIAGQLKSLESGATVVKQGTDTINGVESTKYKITTSIDAALAKADATTRLGLKALKAAGVSKLTTTVWVGPDNLPVKFVQVTPLKGQNVTTTVVYSDWGKPVTITAPPASQVGSFKDLLGG